MLVTHKLQYLPHADWVRACSTVQTEESNDIHINALTISNIFSKPFKQQFISSLCVLARDQTHVMSCEVCFRYMGPVDYSHAGRDGADTRDLKGHPER